MNKEELLKRYFNQEGARGELPLQQWKEILHMVKKQEQNRGRKASFTSFTAKPVLVALAAFVIAVAIGGVSLWAASPWDGGSGQTTTPSGDTEPGLVGDSEPGPVTSRGSCVEQYGPDTLSNRAFAFDGTVKSVEVRSDPKLPAGDQDVHWVTFTVNYWYKGGAGDEVGVWIEGLVLEDSTAIEEGARLLVSGEPRWGGAPLEDAIAWICGGFTRGYTNEEANLWADSLRQ
jgi:hypothetical protein